MTNMKQCGRDSFEVRVGDYSIRLYDPSQNGVFFEISQPEDKLDIDCVADKIKKTLLDLHI